MKKIFLSLVLLCVLIPFSLALSCSETGVTSFAKNAVVSSNNLTLDINVSYKSPISVYAVELFYPDSTSAGSISFTPQSLAGSSSLISKIITPFTKTGAFTYQLKFYPNASPANICTSKNSFTIIPPKTTSSIPDTNIIAVLVALMGVITLISFRKK